MTNFDEASALVAGAAGTFSGVVPEGWEQGRGAFGGLVLALLLRAIERTETDESRRVRALSGEILAPVLPGPIQITVSELRRGSSITYYEARLLQGDALMARASATLSKARKVESVERSPAPPPSEELAELEPLPIGPPLGPAFARAFEYRSRGPYPFSGEDRAECVGLIRLRTPPARLDAPALLAYADAWWPTWLNTIDQPRATATVSFTAEWLVDPATLDASQPLLYAGRMQTERDGYFVEFRELWSGSTLVLLNQQTFAILS